MRSILKAFVSFGFAALLWFGGAPAEAGDTPVQFDVPLAPYCMKGTFPVAVLSGGTTTQGTLSLDVTATGALSGTLSLGGDQFVLTGKQALKKNALAVTLSGSAGTGITVKLTGITKAGSLTGSISGKGGATVLKPRSVFSADLSRAPAMVARCAGTITADDVTGVLSGTGTASFCGIVESVTITGKSTLPAVLASPKPKSATATITLTGTSFKWTGKGLVTLADEDPAEGGGQGYLVTWSARGGGAKSKGKKLRVAPLPPAGDSPGSYELGGALATGFNERITDVVIRVVDAKPSLNPADFTITDNGDPVSSAVRVDTVNRTLTLKNVVLDDGRNVLAITGKDSYGLTLSGQVVVWAGSYTLGVTVMDAQAAPVSGATVTVKLGDDQDVTTSAVTAADGTASFENMPDWTVIVEATGPSNTTASTAVAGSNGTVQLVLQGFDPASPIDNNDFATGDASGWDLGTAPVTVETHVEGSGPTKILATDNDIKLATSGEGPQTIQRTFATKQGTSVVKLRYRFVTTEVPGGYFGTKYNDYFSVSIRSQNAGKSVTEANTMNGLGLAAFDASGSTKWREVTLAVNGQGDTVQFDITVANVADGLLDSYVIVDRVEEIGLDLTVTHATRLLLETNKFEIVVDPSANATDFKIEIRRASEATWYTLGTTKVVDNYKQRVAGLFKLRGTATISGSEHQTTEKDLEVQFPAYADIVGAAEVVTFTDAAWTSTKNAANATTRREEGFFILLNTSAASEKYEKTATVLGPLVGPAQTGSVNIVKPADDPATPTPLESSKYVVASFHTHTPTAFRPVGRAVGPSAADQRADTADGVPGVVYDYVGDAAGNAPARHPLNSPAQLYHSGPARRATPP
jgi:hypothetical protein